MKKFLVSMMAVITAVILVACSNASNKDADDFSVAY